MIIKGSAIMSRPPRGRVGEAPLPAVIPETDKHWTALKAVRNQIKSDSTGKKSGVILKEYASATGLTVEQVKAVIQDNPARKHILGL